MHRTVSVGIDVVELDRMRRLIERHGERAVADLFSETDLEEARRASEPATGTTQVIDRYDIRLLAAKFAAKEATVKALNVPPTLGYRFSDISVLGRSRIIIGLTKRLQSLARTRTINSLLGCISCDREVAMAIVFGVTHD